MKVRTGFCTAGCAACCRVMALPGHLLAELDHTAYVQAPGPLSLPMQQFLAVHGAGYSASRQIVAVPLDRDVRSGEQIIAGTYGGAEVLYLRSTCAALTPDGLCSLYGKPERPATCETWPTILDQLKGVPLVEDACTYTISDDADEGTTLHE